VKAKPEEPVKVLKLLGILGFRLKVEQKASA
jgi:hypothetical protein